MYQLPHSKRTLGGIRADWVIGLARLNKRILASLVPQVAEIAIDGGVLAFHINLPAEEKDNRP